MEMEKNSKISKVQQCTSQTLLKFVWDVSFNFQWQLSLDYIIRLKKKNWEGNSNLIEIDDKD